MIIFLNPIMPKKQQKDIFKWLINYIFYYPSYICLIMAISGFLFTFIQIGIIKYLKPTIITNVAISIDSLINNINSNNYNKYIDAINNNINVKETNINNDLFGWADITTTTLNNTLNNVVNEITNFILKLLSPIIGDQDDSTKKIKINNGLLMDFFDKYEITLYNSLTIYYILLIIWCIVLFMGISKIIYIKNNC